MSLVQRHNVSEILRSNGKLNKVLILSTFYIKMFCERDIFVVSSSSIKFWKISKMFGQLFHGIFTTIKNIWCPRDNVLRQNRLSYINCKMKIKVIQLVSKIIFKSKQNVLHYYNLCRGSKTFLLYINIFDFPLCNGSGSNQSTLSQFRIVLSTCHSLLD